jgi:hypothetical protein
MQLLNTSCIHRGGFISVAMSLRRRLGWPDLVVPGLLHMFGAFDCLSHGSCLHMYIASNLCCAKTRLQGRGTAIVVVRE